MISFYTDRRGEGLVTGRHLFGKEARMWAEWAPAADAAGRDVLVVGQRRKDVPRWLLRPFFAEVSEVRELPVVKNGKIVTRLYWRVGYGYIPPSSER